MSTSYCEQSSRSSNEYSSDSSEYNSSVVTTNTPFPSMTKSQRVKLNEILHRDPIGYVSTFTHESDGWEVIPALRVADKVCDVKPDIKFDVKPEVKDEEIKNSCCCLC